MAEVTKVSLTSLEAVLLNTTKPADLPWNPL